MNWLKTFVKRKAFSLTVSKGQKELLEFFISNRVDFDQWLAGHPLQKMRFQFYYPNAIDFYYSEFKLFTAYFKKNRREEIELSELKMSETNFDSIRCASWAPFEEVMMEFVSSLEESKKTALFEKRKTLYEYEGLCNKKPATESSPLNEYANRIAPSPSTGH
ncbi:MAG TPA: hypothetical protein VER36_05470 [Flavisolibacter sp.]|nr:hypothetical protein [Flavisolibacter sp.]